MSATSGALASSSGPPPPANRRAFGTHSVSSTTATAGAPTPNRAAALNSSTSTTRSAANNNLRSSTMSTSSAHLAPPPLFGTSPGSSTSTNSGATPSGSAAPSANASPTPPGRQRSQSSASAGGAAQLAAERAGQWLSALAPRGEGRTREFITSSLSGVATVASTVGQEVNGFIKAGTGGVGSRPSSFVGSPPEPRARASSRASASTPRRDSFAQVIGAAATAGPSGKVSPPPPANGLNGRSAPRPANMSRLGGDANHQSSHSTTSLNIASPVASPTQHAFVRSSTLPAVATSPAGPSLTPPPGSTSNPSTAGITSPPSPPNAGGHARRGSNHSAHGPPSGHTQALRGHARASSTGGIGLGATQSHSPGISSARVRGAGMPYKIGFQPSGVRHDRTAEFVVCRATHAVDREKEEGRLGRRWAKLVDLHFNPATQARPTATVPAPSTRKGGLLSIDLEGLNPKEVWKGLKMATGPNPEEARKRAAEQTLVKWEEDADVRKCRICAVGFSLSTRKHHCRLCGRIVCSLPPTPPALVAIQTQIFGEPADNGEGGGQDGLPAGMRREKCSLLLVADYRTGRGQEVDEGFVGWMSLDNNAVSDPASAFRAKRGEIPPSVRRAQSPAHTRRSSASSLSVAHSAGGGGGSASPLGQQPQEVQIKGLRVCRDCWAIVSRKQIMAERQRVTPFQRLYVALRSLQAEIDGCLPDFSAELDEAQQQVAADQIDDLDLTDLVAQHKHLLALLGQYDAVAKRIAALPVTMPEESGAGAGQAGVQGALARSAAMFLARAMVQVSAVPRLERAVASAKAKHMVVVEARLGDVLRAEGVGADQADDVARALQPLLEQQAQLESFIAEANAQRKYEDARSLGAALADIEAEIARLTASALQ